MTVEREGGFGRRACCRLISARRQGLSTAIFAAAGRIARSGHRAVQCSDTGWSELPACGSAFLTVMRCSTPSRRGPPGEPAGPLMRRWWNASSICRQWREESESAVWVNGSVIGATRRRSIRHEAVEAWILPVDCFRVNADGTGCRRMTAAASAARIGVYGERL